MSITNYSELKTAVGDWLARPELTSPIIDFIAMAESKMNNELRLRSMIATVNINPSQVNKYVSLPTGFLELISFSDDTGDVLQEVDYEELEDYRYRSGSARPELYSIGARIDFERLAGASHNYPMRYYKRLDIATDSTNDVLTNHPNIYLHGALLQAEPYVQNDERMVMWKAMYDDAVKEENWRDNKNKRKLRTEFSQRQSFNVLRGH